MLFTFPLFIFPSYVDNRKSDAISHCNTIADLPKVICEEVAQPYVYYLNSLTLTPGVCVQSCTVCIRLSDRAHREFTLCVTTEFHCIVELVSMKLRNIKNYRNSDQNIFQLTHFWKFQFIDSIVKLNWSLHIFDIIWGINWFISYGVIHFVQILRLLAVLIGHETFVFKEESDQSQPIIVR